jgi:putative ATPase
MDLFSSVELTQLPGTPLAEKMRPRSLDDWIGQAEIIQLFKNYQKQDFLPNLIFYGAPGCGKTTLARILSKSFNIRFRLLNAIDTGVKAIKEAGEEARTHRRLHSQRTALFVDEIHRMNQSQQDVFLPFIESGDFSLIGATTENPFFELNRALLSRSKVIQFAGPSEQDLIVCFERTLSFLGIGENEFCDPESKQEIIRFSGLDFRVLINTIEHIFHGQPPRSFDLEFCKKILGPIKNARGHHEDLHFDLVSAFIKSIRGSDPNSALYYLASLIKSGASPLFIARRLIILASEDVGNADPRALTVAVSCQQAVDFVGMPESSIILAQTVCYLASAPKSNRSYLAIQKALKFAEEFPLQRVPPPLKNRGADGSYLYPHDFSKGWVSQNYWPSGSESQVFYEPSTSGFEKTMKEFLNWLKS